MITSCVPHSIRQTLPPDDPRSTRYPAIPAAEREGELSFVRGLSAPGFSPAEMRALVGPEPELALSACVARWREVDGADLDEAALSQWDSGDDDHRPAA